MFSNNIGKVEKAINKNNAKALIELANSKDIQLKLAAIAGLGKLVGDDAFNYLVMQLRNTDAQIRIASATALGEMGDKHAKAHISCQLNRESDPAVCEVMNKAMMKIKEY